MIKIIAAMNKTTIPPFKTGPDHQSRDRYHHSQHCEGDSGNGPQGRVYRFVQGFCFTGAFELIETGATTAAVT
jgi:hypothetical protein